QGPIAVMLHEHEEGRQLIAVIAGAVDALKGGDMSVTRWLADSLMAYVQLLLTHIEKENQIVFPMAESMLTPEETSVLAAEFERIDAEQLDSSRHEQYDKPLH